MKNLFLCLSLSLALSSCDQLHRTPENNNAVSYSQLTAKRNYWDSIPGRIKVHDRARPYRYYMNGDPYTGKVEDYYSPGKPKFYGALKNGYAVGPWKYYQSNDSLEQEGAFDDSGYVTGEWRFYDRRGKEDTRLSYKRNGRYVSTDTLMVIYHNTGLRKECTKDSIYTYYPGGATKSKMTADGSSGREWDARGNMIAETKDYICRNNVTHKVTYFIAQGKHKKAYEELLDHKPSWTDEQKEAFKKATSVTLTASGYLSANQYGFQVKVH